MTYARVPFVLALAVAPFATAAACGSSNGTTGAGGHSTSTSIAATTGTGAGGAGGTGGTPPVCMDAGAPSSGIGHVVIIVQENHTFDTYFGNWCTAAPGSNPTCTAGPACCEAAPAKEPGGASPIALDDTQNAAFDPDHHQTCEVAEINMGKMDKFVQGTMCSSPKNFALAPAALVKPYHDLAAQNAIADRYFQPIAGQSSSNDLYLAVAKEVFIDNMYEPDAVGKQCSLTTNVKSFQGPTIADLLLKAGKTVSWYGEGYAAMKAAGKGCPDAPKECKLGFPTYPCDYEPGDVPFAYFSELEKTPGFLRDFEELGNDLAQGSLPDVAYVKGYGFHSEHPGVQITISDGIAFVTSVVNAVNSSCYKDDTLILVTWDEGGGFFDHVAPPPDSAVDNQPYGTRVPLLALGKYAKKGAVSHVTMEHSSIVKFLEWNYLGGKTGQLGARDAVVNNIGSLLDPAATKVTIPDQ